MSDRCWLTITIRETDQKEFIDRLGKPDETGDATYSEGAATPRVKIPGATVISYGEANHGFYEDLVKLAAGGLVFVGHHGSGEAYGPYVFAGAQGLHKDFPADTNGDPTIRYSLATGSPLDGEVEELPSFLKTYVEAAKTLGIPVTD